MTAHLSVGGHFSLRIKSKKEGLTMVKKGLRIAFFMKDKLILILSKPRKILPIVFVVALVIGLVAIRFVGNPPTVADFQNSTSTNISTDGNTISLSFNTSGRVASVSVVIGDKVTKGETLATLDAGVALGAVNQAKGALDLAKAQYGSLSIQYQNAKSQQDILVNNAYRTLLSSGLQAIPFGIADETHNPIVTGTYTCDKVGVYEIDPYVSSVDSGYSFNISGIETGSGNVTYGNPQPFGTCGLSITFVKGFSGSAKWTVTIPNTKSASYQINKNAYVSAVSTRDQVLSQLSANLGQNGSTSADVSSASIQAAQGAYEAALAQYQNNIVVAPLDGTVTFVNQNLKVGQSVTAGQSVITITANSTAN
jgi:biotin carboxyl carrier protein